MILALRSETPEATILLFDGSADPESSTPTASLTWTAGRKLSNNLLPKIKESLHEAKASWSDITGVIVFEGPGSFTGLRISITVANTIAYSLDCPVVASGTEDWIAQGMRLLATSKPGQIALPKYGAEANITRPKR